MCPLFSEKIHDTAGLSRYIAIRVNTDRYRKVLGDIEEEWNILAPGRSFEYSVLVDELDDLYSNEDKFGKFSIVMAFLITGFRAVLSASHNPADILRHE